MQQAKAEMTLPLPRDYDPARDAVQGLFELVAFYCVVWGSVAGAAALVRLGALQVAPAYMQDQRVDMVVTIGVGLGLGVTTFCSFDGMRGAERQRRVRAVATRYGYPIILLLGAALGWFAYGHQGGDEYEEAAISATYRACVSSPICVARAENLNHGNSVTLAVSPKWP